MILLPFLISVILTPLVKQYSIYCGAYAKENKRTVHHGKISRIGGVAIYLAFIITMAIFVKADRQIKGLVIGSSIMFFTGLIDDLIDIKPLVKLTLEVIAAMVLIYFGVSVDIIRLPLGIQIDTGIISFIFTIIWVAGITNAVNLIDGLDGLATGLSMVAIAPFIIYAIMIKDYTIASYATAMVGALLGFMYFNYHPARIFMGDVGSLGLGGFLAILAILTKQELLLIVVGGVFLMETLSVIIQVVSFKTRGKRVFKMAPIHHHFEMLGWSEQQVTISFWFIGFICGIIAIVIGVM